MIMISHVVANISLIFQLVSDAYPPGSIFENGQ